MVPGLAVETQVETGKVTEAAELIKEPRQVCAELRTWTSPGQGQEWGWAGFRDLDCD